MNFTSPSTSAIVDRYSNLSITVPAMSNNDAFEVTYVVVEVETLEDGVVYVTANAHGYALTKKGTRKAGGVRQMFGIHDSEERSDLIREAALATLTRHGIATDGVEGVELRPWAEVNEARLADLRERFGV